MGSEEKSNLEGDRLKSLLLQLQSESGILDRVVYKGKNQHRRCPYFHPLSKVRRDVKLLLSAGLGEILTALFPILEGKTPAQKAYLPLRLKEKKPSHKHTYQERLLGVARLLSQMTEPILKAAIQISFLLAKSFFPGFSITVMSLLARFRVLVQQILLDVVSVFNKVSSLSQNKHSVKVNQEGIEAFREYYPLTGDVVALECVWENDKFVLLERTHKRRIDNQDVDQGPLQSAPSIQYETIELFNEVLSDEHRFSSETQREHTEQDPQPANINTEIHSSTAQSESPSEGEKHFIKKRSAVFLNPEPESRKKKPAFVSVSESKSSERNTLSSNKKMKLDLFAGDGMKIDDPFLSLLLGGNTDNSIF